MTLHTVFESFMTLNTKADNLWSMFIVVQLGVFWFFFFMHRPLLAIERTIAVAAYTVFTAVNGTALVNTYRLLEAVRRDIVQSFRGEMAQVPNISNVLGDIEYATRSTLIMVTHGGAWVVVVLMVMFRNRLIVHYHRHYSRHPGAQAGALG